MIKKIILLSIIFFACISFGDINPKCNPLYDQYKWLDKELYTIVERYAIINKIPSKIICAFIQVESQGRNIISKRNKNNTHDYGYMQINSVHAKDNPKKLLNPNDNIKFGAYYLSKCYKKAQGDLKLTAYYYNHGINKNFKHYKITDQYSNKIYLAVNR